MSVCQKCEGLCTETVEITIHDDINGRPHPLGRPVDVDRDCSECFGTGEELSPAVRAKFEVLTKEIEYHYP